MKIRLSLRWAIPMAALICSSAAMAQPCLTASPACTEWVSFTGSAPARSLIYRTYPLETRNEKITRALVMIHGAGRDAHNYFRTAYTASFLANATDNTVVIAPRFASSAGRSCNDSLDANEVNWSCSGDSWRSGGVSTNNPKLTSYDLMDEILRKLSNKSVFPNLKRIVIAGHSAGGQYVTRYAMSAKLHDKLGVAISYVVSNPSSYAWLDADRPAGEKPEFGAFRDARNCTTYDKWPYGMKDRTGYTADIPDEQLKAQMVARPVTYLLGEIDILPLGGFDSSCPAMAQGPTRLASGQSFAKYMNQRYGAKHSVTVVPLCGHNNRCMFTADVAAPILFPQD